METLNPPANKKSAAAIADFIGNAKELRERANLTWAVAREYAIGLRKKSFHSREWLISVLHVQGNKSYDSKKLDKYFAANNINPERFKTQQEDSYRIIVKHI